MNAHGMHEMEDKVAEDFILSARKHLFMANNLFAMFMFVKDRKKEAGYEMSSHPTPTLDVYSNYIQICIYTFVQLYIHTYTYILHTYTQYPIGPPLIKVYIHTHKYIPNVFEVDCHCM